jgi:hypothetical protein
LDNRKITRLVHTSGTPSATQLPWPAPLLSVPLLYDTRFPIRSCAAARKTRDNIVAMGADAATATRKRVPRAAVRPARRETPKIDPGPAGVREPLGNRKDSPGG